MRCRRFCLSVLALPQMLLVRRPMYVLLGVHCRRACFGLLITEPPGRLQRLLGRCPRHASGRAGAAGVVHVPGRDGGAAGVWRAARTADACDGVHAQHGAWPRAGSRRVILHRPCCAGQVPSLCLLPRGLLHWAALHTWLCRCCRFVVSAVGWLAHGLVLRMLLIRPWLRCTYQACLRDRAATSPALML